MAGGFREDGFCGTDKKQKQNGEKGFDRLEHEEGPEYRV